MKAALVVTLLLVCAGCKEHDAERARLADAKYRATLENRGIGRFQMVAATGDYPPFILDTVTGCVQRISATGTMSKQPVFDGRDMDHACLGDMPRDQERELMEKLKK